MGRQKRAKNFGFFLIFIISLQKSVKFVTKFLFFTPFLFLGADLKAKSGMAEVSHFYGGRENEG